MKVGGFFKSHWVTAKWQLLLEWQPIPVVLACRIPWTEEPGRPQSMGSQRVGHDWSDLKVKTENEVAQSCPTLCNPVDCSPPGSSIHGIFQARVLEWVAISFSRGSSWPRDRTWVSRIAGRHFYCLSHHTLNPTSLDSSSSDLSSVTCSLPTFGGVGLV